MFHQSHKTFFSIYITNTYLYTYYSISFTIIFTITYQPNICTKFHTIHYLHDMKFTTAS